MPAGSASAEVVLEALETCNLPSFCGSNFAWLSLTFCSVIWYRYAIHVRSAQAHGFEDLLTLILIDLAEAQVQDIARAAFHMHAWHTCARDSAGKFPPNFRYWARGSCDQPDLYRYIPWVGQYLLAYSSGLFIFMSFVVCLLPYQQKHHDSWVLHLKSRNEGTMCMVLTTDMIVLRKK